MALCENERKSLSAKHNGNMETHLYKYTCMACQHFAKKKKSLEATEVALPVNDKPCTFSLQLRMHLNI